MSDYVNTRDTLNDPTGQITLDKLIADELTDLTDDKVFVLAYDAFSACRSSLQSVCFPKLQSMDGYVFSSSSPLITARINGRCAMNARSFGHCYNLKSIILTGNELNTSTSSGPLFLQCAVATNEAMIYVEDEMVNTLKSDERFKPYEHLIFGISEYPREHVETITDTWTQILAASANGTYAQKYNVGDTARIAINGNRYLAQLIAKDADTKTAGGTAHMTWIIRSALPGRAMNSNATTSGGWKDSDMRSYLNTTMFGLLPQELQAEGAIVPVNKTYYDATASNGEGATLTCSDKLWLLSSREICYTNNAQYEDSGVQYSGIFSSNGSRLICDTNGEIQSNWLRSANDTTFFDVIYSDGRVGSALANQTKPIVFGFCV